MESMTAIKRLARRISRLEFESQFSLTEIESIFVNNFTESNQKYTITQYKRLESIANKYSVPVIFERDYLTGFKKKKARVTVRRFS